MTGFLPQSGIEVYAVAAVSTLRAHAAEVTNSQDGLKSALAVASTCGCNARPVRRALHWFQVASKTTGDGCRRSVRWSKWRARHLGPLRFGIPCTAGASRCVLPLLPRVGGQVQAPVMTQGTFAGEDASAGLRNGEQGVRSPPPGFARRFRRPDRGQTRDFCGYAEIRGLHIRPHATPYLV